MADKSKIEWTEATWNPIRAKNKATGGVGHFCEILTAGCSNCYAQRMQPRFQNDIRYNKADRDKVDIFLDEKVLTQPLRWTRSRIIFPCSMTDIFGEWVSDEWLDKMFAVMALTPQHTYQVLTKRPERMQEYLTHTRLAANGKTVLNRHYLIESQGWWGEFGGIPIPIPIWPLPNVWLGVSAEDQKTADERIPLLLETPAAKRWISAEPLLGPIDFTAIPIAHGVRLNALNGRQYIDDGRAVVHNGEIVEGPRIDWMVVGAESGPKARPMHPVWARDIRDQCLGECEDCRADGARYLRSTGPGFKDDVSHWVKCDRPGFFFKQWGEWYPVTRDATFRVRERNNPQWHIWPDEGFESTVSKKVGKHAAGRELDGRTWDEMPEVTTV